MQKSPSRNGNAGALAIMGLVVAIFSLALISCGSNRSNSSGSSNMTNKPLEYQLAYIDSGGTSSENDASVGRFKYLLDTLETKTKNSRQEIADMTVAAQKVAREKYGRQYKLIELMEDVNLAIPDNSTTKFDYAEILTSIIVISK